MASLSRSYNNHKNYATENRVSTYMQQKETKLKGELDNSAIMFEISITHFK